MILELNATEIIACAVDKHVKTNVKTDNMAIRINHIQNVARKMELEMPTLLTDCDLDAIEDCQFAFKRFMTIESSYVRIRQVREVNPRLSRYLPKHEIYVKILEKI